jgi:dipeptidyl aminopeptidase/acylaminoacyl peptidase
MRRTAVLVALAVSVAGCATAACSTVDDGEAHPVRVHPEELRVTGARAFDAPGPVRVSPNGTQLLRLTGKLCVTALDGSAEKCASPDVRPDSLHAQWSPDGTKIAFTDDFYVRLLEPDVWVFDVRTGETRNVTDDGVDKVELGKPDPEETIDLLPSWSPDGRFVRFARGTSGSDTSALMSIDVVNGELAAVREVHCGIAELTALTWSSQRVAWTCGITDAQVHAAEISQVREWTVLRAAEREDRMLLSFSPDGESLLVDSLAPYETADPGGGRASVVPATGGKARPVADGPVAFPAWVPDSGALVYVAPPGRLMLVTEPGTNARELRSAKRLAATDGRMLAWGEDTMFVAVDGELNVLSMTASG